IFIYSFVHMGQLIGEKYFNVLKLKNVDLIKYNTNSFQEALETWLVPAARQVLKSGGRVMRLVRTRVCGDGCTAQE
ncbi:MAG: hypothetical protein RIR74_1474, partial [Pseudomonadota bacterium]